MASKEKWLAPLSTTEPNHIGIIKVRQDNKNSETFYIPIVQNGEEFDMTQDGITKVYFCTKFKPFNPVEQEATIVDAKKGVIKYTMNNYDMQKPGLQTAYFKFIDKDGNYQGATQSFTYMIIKSIEQECTDSETYIVRLEQLVDLYNQFFETNSQSWKEFVESNREILESIDPGGKIMTELIDFRHSKMLNKTFDKIKDRGDFWDEQIIPAWKSPAQQFKSLPERLDKEIGDISSYRKNENLVEKIRNSNNERGLNVLDYGLIGDGKTPNDEAMKNLLEQAKNMINVYNGHLPIFFPVGKFRFVKAIRITQQRITLTGSGFDTYILGDSDLVSLEVPREPEALSSTFIIKDMLMICSGSILKSTEVESSVDISVHRVWFGKAKHHIHGSFVTLNASGCIFEQASEGSIFSQTKGGFRKIVISGNNFYGNSKFDINIAGDTNYLLHHSINITGNSFDQARSDLLNQSGMIRMSYCRDFLIKSNIFNGEGDTPLNGMISLINCKDFEIDNEYNFSKGTAIFVQNSHTFRVKGVLSNGEKGVHVSNSNSFDVDMILSEMSDDGITIDNCDDWRVSGRVKTGNKDGIVSLGSRDGIIDASVTDCNRGGSTTGSGISLKVAASRASKRIFIQNNKVSGSKGYNIRVETGCEDNILNNISLGSNPKSTILDVGTRTVQKDIYTFTA